MPQRPSGPGLWRPAALLAFGLLLAALAFGRAGRDPQADVPRDTAPDAAALQPRPLATPPAPVAPRPDDDVREEIEALRAALAEEREARARLAEQVASLQASLDELDQRRVAAPTPAVRRAPAQRARAGRRWIDRDVLRSAGFSESEAERLAYAFDSIEMDRLELENRATREGWRRTGRFTQAHAQIEQRILGLRGQLDEEEYDWLLFASGRPNRVVVRDVLGVSPAAEAGMAPGDRILSYAGERVYSHRELVGATTEGRAGELVRVEVERNGEPRTVFVPRGPLGVQIGPIVERPERLG